MLQRADSWLILLPLAVFIYFCSFLFGHCVLTASLPNCFVTFVNLETIATHVPILSVIQMSVGAALLLIYIYRKKICQLLRSPGPSRVA